MGGNAQAKVSIVSKTLKEASHFELSGLGEWRYEVKQMDRAGGHMVTVQFSDIKPEELQTLENFRDNRVQKVVVKEGLNKEASVDFYLASQMNFFDYQTDASSEAGSTGKFGNLIFDIYKDEKKSAKALVKSSKSEKSLGSKGLRGVTGLEGINSLAGTFVTKLPAKNKASGRGIASVDNLTIGSQPLLSNEKKAALPEDYNVLDVADREYKRFTLRDEDVNADSIIKSEKEIYLPFPALVTPITPSLVDLESNKITFDVTPENTEENKIVRLILRLFNEEKLAMALKTQQFFKEKYPVSSYNEILHLMKAEIYYKLWTKNKSAADYQTALSFYKEHLVKFPESPYKDKLAYFIGLNYFDGGEYVEAFARFQSAVKDNSKSTYYWPMKMAMAECYRALRQEDQALELLDSVEKDPKSGVYASQAGFKRGDVYFKSKKFEQAIAEYQTALKKYPKNINDSPNAFYNTAESMFRSKQYKKALDAYRVFIQKFPDHEYASYAMNRLASLLEILGAPTDKILGAYLESYYRYRGTPAAYISKMRINKMRFPNMKAKEVDAVVKEAFDEMPVGKIEDVQAFTKLTVADGFLARKQFDKSFDTYTRYYKENVMSEHLPLFKDRILGQITDEIKDLKDKNDDMAVIQKYLKNKEGWLKDNTRVDTDYYVGQAYEGLNLYDEATKLYDASEKRVVAHTAGQEARRRIFEDDVSSDSLRLREAATSFKSDDIKRASQQLQAIKNAADLTPEEKVEFALVSADVAEKEGRFDTAIGQLQNLSEMWKGKSELLLKPWMKISKIYDAKKSKDQAENWAQKSLNLIKDAEDPAKRFGLSTVRDVLTYSADLYYRDGENTKAIKVYKDLLENFMDDKTPSGALKYKLGKIYFDQKNIIEAKKIWGDLKKDSAVNPGDALWSKMAAENLSQYTWSEKFKRYVDRKPASDSGSSK